ncbi:hypothetical protein BDF14DRAFT_964381 [Spinellus fusiger]|nr:hypothetical protein BDF14DRAFT_964381 [Spinellus fusiger]
MKPITVKEYLYNHESDNCFDFVELLKMLEPEPLDRNIIEQEIKKAVNEILQDKESTRQKRLALAIAISDFRILHCQSTNNFWSTLNLQRISCRNALSMQEQANQDLQPSVTRADSYRTRSKSRQPIAIKNDIKNENVYEMDGIVLGGMTQSVGSIIKTEAKRMAKKAKTYTNLTGEAKNSVFLGFNSIVDLSNNSTDEDSQCSFFLNKEWQQLKNLFYEPREMTPLSKYITDDLEKIEKVYLLLIITMIVGLICCIDRKLKLT